MTHSRASTCAGGYAAVEKRLRDHAAGEPLAVADDQIVGPLGQFADRGQPAKNFIESIKMVVNPGGELVHALRRNQLRGRIEMPLPQAAN